MLLCTCVICEHGVEHSNRLICPTLFYRHLHQNRISLCTTFDSSVKLRWADQSLLNNCFAAHARSTHSCRVSKRCGTVPTINRSLSLLLRLHIISNNSHTVHLTSLIKNSGNHTISWFPEIEQALVLSFFSVGSSNVRVMSRFRCIACLDLDVRDILITWNRTPTKLWNTTLTW